MHHMFRAIRRIIDEHDDVKVIYPIHMNPVVRQAAAEELGNFDRIRIIDPLEVLDFHNFLARSYLILTDSGGIQEEAPGLGGGGQDADEVLRLPQDGVQLRDGADFIEVRAPGPAAAGDAGDVGRAHAL